MKLLSLLLLSACAAGSALSQTISNINPNSGSQGTWSLPISISGSGTNFSAATNTILTINQGNNQLEVLSATVVSPTQVSAMIRIPYNSNIGLYDVSVFDQNSGPISLNNGFTVVGNPIFPYIIETYPDSVRQNATLPVTISTAHTNFVQATDNIIYLTQGTHTLYPIPGSVEVLSNDSIRATFNFAQPYLSIGTLVNSHCGNSFDGILSDFESILIIDSTLSVTEPDEQVKLMAYPNPTTGGLRIDIPEGLVNFDLTVHNQLGQQIITRSVSGNYSQSLLTDITSLPNGVYMVSIVDREQRYSIQIVKE